MPHKDPIKLLHLPIITRGARQRRPGPIFAGNLTRYQTPSDRKLDDLAQQRGIECLQVCLHEPRVDGVGFDVQGIAGEEGMQMMRQQYHGHFGVAVSLPVV